jgi:hypothetical protein
MRKEMESLRAEKEAAQRKLDTLETANERLVDMKVGRVNIIAFLKYLLNLLPFSLLF